MASTCLAKRSCRCRATASWRHPRWTSQHIEAKNYDGIAADAAAMMELFQEVGAFWTERDVEDALESCGQIYMGAQALQQAAEAHDDDAIATPRVVPCLVVARPATPAIGKKSPAVATSLVVAPVTRGR